MRISKKPASALAALALTAGLGGAAVLTASPASAAERPYCNTVIGRNGASVPWHTATGANCYVGYNPGHFSQPVLVLQRALNKCHGYDLDEDGSFGGDTWNAVREFQRSEGLADDGDAGPATMGRMLFPTGGRNYRCVHR